MEFDEILHSERQSRVRAPVTEKRAEFKSEFLVRKRRRKLRTYRRSTARDAKEDEQLESMKDAIEILAACAAAADPLPTSQVPSPVRVEAIPEGPPWDVLSRPEMPRERSWKDLLAFWRW